MLSVRTMHKDDVSALYEIALLSFRPDYEKYGVYPPLINEKRKGFLPPLVFGKTILAGDTIIGGAFVSALGKRGEIGSIFLEPDQQRKGYGKQAMRAIEEAHPGVKRWKLETLAESAGLHAFYESMGYIRTGEMRDKKSGIRGFVYEKEMA